MKITQSAAILFGGVALYVIVAAVSRGGWRSGRAFIEQLAHPVAPALADPSGTRLKARYTAGADGSRIYQPDRLYDSQLGVDCVFGTGADKKVHCLPTLAPDGVGAPLYYSDAKCTQGLLTQLQPGPQGCTPKPAKYVYTQEAPGFCDSQTATTDTFVTHLYEVGGLASSVAAVYQLNGTNCQLTGLNSQNAALYTLGAELPATSFAAGTPGTGS